MSEIRQRILDQVVNPLSRQNQTAVVQAKILEADETNNWCSIEYVDKDGYSRNRDNVWVKQYGDGRMPWFPKVGELVLVEDYGDSAVITEKFWQNYALEIDARRQLKKDIYPDNFGSSMGGYIF